MSWSTLPPALRELAEKNCTSAQLDALKLWNGRANFRFIGHTLGISASSARDRVHRAIDAVTRAAEREGLDPTSLRSA